MVKIAIMGHGVVGSGVAEVLCSHADNIAKRAKEEIDIKYILDIRDFPDNPLRDRFIKDFSVIEQDPEVRIVVETMGGLHPAYDFVKRCLLAGKNVVTSNKELVAAKGAELLAIAQKRNLNFLFEASVGGGIPIIRPMSQCLAANEVIEIAGILNGTTNFILTKMIDDSMDFSEALALAQKLGYAERDPSADVEGHDTCRKICILASLAYGRHVYPDQVHTEGISGVTLADVEYARAWGGEVKLIGRVKRMDDGKLSMIVCPMFLPRESQLANVGDVFNGILVRGDSTGDVVFYGKGAGKLPTASAVVADVIDCVKHFRARKYLFWEEGQENYVRDYLDDETAMFLRLRAENVALAAENTESLLPGAQRLYRKQAPKDELAFVVPEMQERKIRENVDRLEKLGISLASMIRVTTDL